MKKNLLTICMLSAISLASYAQLKLGEAVVTKSSVSSAEQVVKIYNVKDHNGPTAVPAPTLGNNWGIYDYSYPNWTGQALGQVFGLAIDNKRQRILTATTQVYPPQASYTYANGYTYFGASGTANQRAAGSPLIWSLDPSVAGGGATALVVSTTAAALPTIGFNNSMYNRGTDIGNLCYDKAHDQVFATNMEDGMIYRIQASTGAILSRYDPFGQYVPNGGAAPSFVGLDERVWGIGYKANKLYFSRWRSDMGHGTGLKNEIYMVNIDPVTGNFLMPLKGSLTRDFVDPVVAPAPIISVPFYPGTSNRWANPVSDIELSADGNTMYVAERTMSDVYNSNLTPIYMYWAHRSRVLRYDYSGGTWNASANSYYVGNYDANTNSTGGVDLGYAVTPGDGSAFSTNCEQLVWAAGDALKHTTYHDSYHVNNFVYGFAGLPKTGNSIFNNSVTDPTAVNNTSIVQDVFSLTGYTGYLGTGGYPYEPKEMIGDIDIYREPCGCDGTEDISDYKSLPATVTGGMVLSDKYYIDKMVTFVGGVVDITNVDLIFSGCGAGIRLTEGATLRANNSVFRPCSMNGVWAGIDLSGAATTNFVNSCVIKNAATGISSINTAQTKITETEFYNCYYGIVLGNNNGSTYTLPVSSNTFVTDNQIPSYTGCTNVTAGGPIYNIVLGSTTMQGNISQNRFVNQATLNTQPVSGIFMMLNSSANISENIFTDMKRAIEMQSCQSTNITTIQNNTIESYNLGSTEHTQILVSSSNLVNVTGNSIKDNMTTSASALDAAISFQSANTVNARQNKISGFAVGIYSNGVNGSNTVSNTIDHSSFGIYEISSSNTYISCNTISDNAIAGIEIKEHSKSALTINTNCINNSANIAIWLTASVKTDVKDASWVIRNNSLYNYLYRGFLDNNYTSVTLGTSTGSIPGMNTFWSNSPASVIDVDAGTTGSIQIYMNYNIVTTAGSVTRSDHGEQVYSTAECGHQINSIVPTYPTATTMQTNLTSGLLCDPAGGFGKTNSPTDNGYIMYLRYNEMIMTDRVQALQYAASLNDDNTVSASDKAIFNYHLHYDAQDWTACAHDLQSFAASTDEDRCIRLSYDIETRLASGATTISTLPDADLAQLRYYSALPYTWANYARQYLIARGETGLLNVDKIADTQMEAGTSRVNDITKDKVNIYPNPASNQLNVTFSITEVTAQYAEIRIYDILGNLVIDQPTSMNAGQQTIDVSGLALGAYLVSVQADGKKIADGVKFVKVR